VKHKISIVSFEEHENTNLYSIVIDNNDRCETELFFNDLVKDNKKDAIQMVNLLDKIAKNGAQERYFRYEGARSDNICALPDHYLLRTDYRLYLIRLSESILILGNGGIKTTNTYQEDPPSQRLCEIITKGR
jgi:hypothetical protein